jgi:hypothetical protein
MSKRMVGRKWFEVIQHGELFDSFDGGGSVTVPHNPTGPDGYATHKNRDEAMIKLCRTYGEVLVHGLADSRDIGRYLIEMCDEAESLEAEVKFGYEK